MPDQTVGDLCFGVNDADNPGTAYICGAGDEEALPPSADLVKPSPKAIAQLHHQAKNLSPVFEPGNAETKAEQACYLPMADRGRPFVGKVQGVEGVYIGSGSVISPPPCSGTDR